MLDLLERTYLAIFRRYPVLLRMALVVLLGEIVLAAVNNFALPFYVNKDLGQPMRVVGVLISTFLVAEMLLKLPAGHLSDRYGRRYFISFGVAACAATPLVVCAIPTQAFLAAPLLVYLALLPTRIMDGAGSAALWPPLFASVPDHIPSERCGVAMSVMNTAYIAGLMLGPALASLAMKVAGALHQPEWLGKAPFVMAAVFAVAAAIVAWRLPAQRTAPPSGSQVAGAVLPPFRVALVVIAITFCDMFATAILAPYILPYISRLGGVEPSNVGFLMLLLVIPAAVLGMPIGHLSDRWPRRRVVQLALLTAAAGLWAAPLARNLPELFAAAGVVMLGFMFGLPSWLALITDLAPAGASGRVMGLMATAQGFGAFLGPFVGGVLWDREIRLPFYVAAVMLTLSACVALIFLGKLLGPRRKESC
jgi:DHA1 family multidrug resistance protein-like MFS transporter